MATEQKRGWRDYSLAAVFAFIAFIAFININSAHSDRIGHGWYIGAGIIGLIGFIYQLYKFFKNPTTRY